MRIRRSPLQKTLLAPADPTRSEIRLHLLRSGDLLPLRAQPYKHGKSVSRLLRHSTYLAEMGLVRSEKYGQYCSVEHEPLGFAQVFPYLEQFRESTTQRVLALGIQFQKSYLPNPGLSEISAKTQPEGDIIER